MKLRYRSFHVRFVVGLLAVTCAIVSSIVLLAKFSSYFFEQKYVLSGENLWTNLPFGVDGIYKRNCNMSICSAFYTESMPIIYPIWDVNNKKGMKWKHRGRYAYYPYFDVETNKTINILQCLIAKNAGSLMGIFFNRLMNNTIWKKQFTTNHYAYYYNSTKYKYMRIWVSINDSFKTGLINNDIINKFNSNKWIKFIIIRDPLLRFISAYLDKCCNAPDQDNNLLCKQFNISNPNIDNLNQFINYSYHKFNNFKMKEKHSTINWGRVDHHFRAQSVLCQLDYTFSKYQYIEFL